MLATFCLHAGYMLATGWIQAGYILATCWLQTGYRLATGWLQAGYRLAIYWHNCDCCGILYVSLPFCLNKYRMTDCGFVCDLVFKVE